MVSPNLSKDYKWPLLGKPSPNKTLMHSDGLGETWVYRNFAF